MKLSKKHIRTLVQLFFLTLVGLIAVNHTLAESGQSIPFLASASVHAICPFGGVETFYQLLTTGSYIQKIHSSALVLMGIAFTLTIIFGPVICGWVCPLGSIQEWVGRLGKRLLGKRYNQLMPKRLDKILRYLRYVLLALVLYNTAVSGMLLFANADPYYALFHFWTGETAVAALVILGLTLGLSLVVERPWCKYACPYGALLGVFNPIRLFKIRRQPSSCIDCGNCDRACPMNIQVSNQLVVRDHQCISCLQCTSEQRCPVEKTVTFGKISSLVLGITVLGLMFGGISLGSALGIYQTESDKVPAKYSEGQAEGAYDPADIRGSYTLREVSELFEIDEAVLREAFQIPETADLSAFKSKDIEPLYENATEEIGNSSLQVFVALYKGLPISLADVFLPEPAVRLIEANNPALSPEEKAYLDTHTLILETAPAPAPATTPGQGAGSGSTETAAAEPAVNGQTTFKGLLDLGISQAQIEAVIQGPMPMTNLSVRDYCRDQGLAFSEVKAAFLELVKN